MIDAITNPNVLVTLLVIITLLSSMALLTNPRTRTGTAADAPYPRFNVPLSNSMLLWRLQNALRVRGWFAKATKESEKWRRGMERATGKKFIRFG